MNTAQLRNLTDRELIAMLENEGSDNPLVRELVARLDKIIQSTIDKEKTPV